MGIGGEYAAINSAIDELIPAKYQYLVLTKFYGVDEKSAPGYLIAFRVGNLAGPLTIGRHFDTIGQKQMISGTYILSGVLLAITASLFKAGALTATTQTIAWCVFFLASAWASAAYLTVSEIFPLEVRAQAIAVFFAIAPCFGALGPIIYGHLIGNGSDPNKLFIGYLIGATVVVLGGLVEVFLGVPPSRSRWRTSPARSRWCAGPPSRCTNGSARPWRSTRIGTGFVPTRAVRDLARSGSSDRAHPAPGGRGRVLR